MFLKSNTLTVSWEYPTVRSKIIAKSFRPYHGEVFTKNSHFVHQTGNFLKNMHYNKHAPYEPYEEEEESIQDFDQNWKYDNEDEKKHQRQQETDDNNYNPYHFQQPDCNRVPPYHPNPNEMYNERERRAWHNSHHSTPSHYDYTRRSHKRRPSHLMDIWRPNYDEDENRRDRYTFSRSHSPNNRRYDLQPVTFIDRPPSSRFKKHSEFNKNKTSATSTYTNKTVNADTKEKKPSNPSASASTERQSNPKPKPDEPKSVSDEKIAESKSPIVEKVIETPDITVPEPQVTNKIEAATTILDISGISNISDVSGISDISIDSLVNSSPTGKEKELEDSQTKQILQEMPSEISPKAKTVPLLVDDHEKAIDIEKALKTITNHSDSTTVDTDKTKSCLEISSEADDIIVINTEDTYLFTLDDIDKTRSFLDYNEVIDMDLGSPLSFIDQTNTPSITQDKSYLDYNEIVDMDLGSPLPSPSIDQTNTPCMTQDELLRQLNEEIGETTSDNITTNQLKVVLDSNSKTSSPSRSVDDATKSKVTKRSLSQTDGSDDIKKRRLSKSNRRYSTYERASPPKIKGRRASVITDRRSSTSSESSGGARSKNKSSKETVEPTEEVKINPYYPSLSQYKIPKKKPVFSSPDRPFCTSISELFGEYDKDDSTKSPTSQEVNKDTGRTKKSWDEYSKPEQKDSKNLTNKHITSQEVNKDSGRTKKGCDEYSKPEQKDSKNTNSREVKDAGKNKKGSGEYTKTEQKDNLTIKQDTAKTNKCTDYSKPVSIKEAVIASKKKLKVVVTKDIKVSQRANNVNEPTKAAIANKAKKVLKGKIIQKSCTVKDAIKTTDEQVHTKKPKSKPNTSVSSKKDAIKSDQSKHLVVKENKKRVLEPNNPVKQDYTKSEKKNSLSTKRISKNDKQKSTKLLEEPKSQKIPEKRRKINAGSNDAGEDKCHSKQLNLEKQVIKPSSEEKVDKNQSKVKDNDKCVSLADDLLSTTSNQKHEPKDKINTPSDKFVTDDLLSISTNQKHVTKDKIDAPSDKCVADDILSVTANIDSEPRDKITTPIEKCALTDDLLSITANRKHEPKDRINTPSDKCALTNDLLSITANKHSEPRDKINTPIDKCALTNDLLSITANKHSEPRDKINTPSDKCALTDDLLSITANKNHSVPRDTINTPSDKCALTDDLLSITANKNHSVPKDTIINTPSDKCALTDDLLSITANKNHSVPSDTIITPSDKCALTDDLLSIATNKKHSETSYKINTPSDNSALTDDLLSITANKHSEPKDKINTPSSDEKVDETLPDNRDEHLEAQHAKLLSLVSSISRAENQILTVEETSVDANKIDFVAKSSDKKDPNDATMISPAKESESLDSIKLQELMNKLNKYFPVLPEQEVPKASDHQETTTNITEDDKSEPIKKENPSNLSDIQIKTAVKSEHSELEKVQPLILDAFPPSEKPRMSTVESDCIEVAFVMDSPDLHENVEIVLEEKKDKENDSQDVIEIKEDITVIDLTDEPEENVANDDLLQIMEDINSDSKEKITLYRSEESQDNTEEVLAMSASLRPSAVLHTDTKTEPIKSEVNFDRQIQTENESYSNISSPESVATTPNKSIEDVQAKKQNLVNSRRFAESTNDETSNLNSSDALPPPLLKAKTFLSVNKNLFEKDTNDATRENGDALKNRVEISTGQTSSSSSILVRALDMADVSHPTSSLPDVTANQTRGVLNNEQERWMGSDASASSSSISNDGNVPNGAVSSTDRPYAPNSSAISVSVLSGVQTDRTQEWPSSAISVPNNSIPADNVQAARTQQWTSTQSSSAISISNNGVPVVNQTQEWARSGAPVLNSPSPNDTVSSANPFQGWKRSFSVPNGTVTLSTQPEQWPATSGASVSSASAISVSVPKSSVPPANRTQQWTRTGPSTIGVSVSNDTGSAINQTHGWTRSIYTNAVSSVSQQQGIIPSEQWLSRTLNDIQSGSNNLNRSTGTANNETNARGNENDLSQVNSSLLHKMPSSSPNHSSWHQCMADFVVLAIKNHIWAKQNLKSSNVCPLTQKVEQLVIDFRWKIYGEQIMRFLSNTMIEEMEPIENMVMIYQRVQSHGLSSLPQFFLCLEAIMSQTKEFYLNHRSLWKFYHLVHANANEIRLKANKSASPQPLFTQQQIGTLNTQIDFCNMVTKHYQINNVPSTPRRSSNLSNSINQKFSTIRHTAPAKQSRSSAQVTRNVVVNQQSPNMYNTMLPPQRGNQQSVIQQQRLSASNTPHPNPIQSPVNKSPNVYVQTSNNHIGTSTPYSNILKQIINGKQPVNINLPNSAFKVPSQLRSLRKTLPSSSTAVNEPQTNAPVPSYGMSPAYNAPVQNSANNNNAHTFRRDTPRYVMPSMTHIKKHIYAPMMFTPNYSTEQTPVTESPAPPRYQSPSHESPVNVLPNKETPPAMSPIIASSRNQMPVTGSPINTPINQTSFNGPFVSQSPINEQRDALQSPINERSSLQSPINDRGALQSSINESSSLQSPINERSAIQFPINERGTVQSPINERTALPCPITERGALQSPINKRCALQSPVNVPLASPSPVSESPANRPNTESPINESVDSGESCDSGTKVNEDDEMVIDLTWLDDFDCDELKEEVDFITIKKEEFDEDEVVLNEEQFPLASSPTDSGIESSPSPQVEYSELVYHGRLCICEQPAEYVCECRLAMYCSNLCQNGDWAQHKRICLKAKSKQPDS